MKLMMVAVLFIFALSIEVEEVRASEIDLVKKCIQELKSSNEMSPECQSFLQERETKKMRLRRLLQSF